MRRLLGLGALAGVACLPALLLARPAAAELVEGQGRCSGRATLTGSDATVTVDEGTSEAVEVPRSAEVTYEGRMAGPDEEGEDMAYDGRVRVDLPPPLPSVTAREWSGVTDATSGSGTTGYDLGGALPEGTRLGVEVVHRQAGERCRATYTVEIDGGSSAAAYASYLLTGATGALLLAVGRAPA